MSFQAPFDVDMQPKSMRARTSYYGRVSRWLRNRFQLFHLTQMDQMGCGPTCLRMISGSFGQDIDGRTAARLIPTSRVGISIADMIDGAARIGLEATPQWVHPDALAQLPFPVILLWRQSHYVVLWGMRRGRYLISDPAATGKILVDRADIDQYWTVSEDGMGIALLCKTAADFPKIAKQTSARPHALLRYLATQRRNLTYLALLYFLIVAVTLSVPLLIVHIYKSIREPSETSSTTTVIVLVLTVSVARFAFEHLRSRTLLRISAHCSEQMLHDFLSKVFGFTFLQYSQKKFGDYLMKLNAYERIRAQIKSASFYVIFDVITLVAAAALLATIEPRVALIYGLCLGIIVAAALFGLPRARLLRFQGYNVQSVTRTMEADILRGMQDIKAARKEVEFRDTWADQISAAHLVDDELISLRELQRNFSTLILGICTVVAIVLMVGHVRAEDAPFSDLLLVMIVLGLVSVPTHQFAEFVRSIDDLSFYIKQLEDIHDMIGMEPSMGAYSLPIERNRHESLPVGLRLEAVRFSHPTDRHGEILSGIDLTIPKGKTVAVFGASGSGKSTLAKIATGIYAPLSGGAVWAVAPYAPLCARVGSVLQDSMLFTLSASENIAFGIEPDAVNAERLAEVISLCALDEVMKRLPMGRNTILGPSGFQVSGGEKQRILIARALYENPDFLVLDEATSGLDKATENRILCGIRAAYPDLTILMISHSEAIARLADMVVLLENGKLAAQGSHEHLLSQCPTYARLLRAANPQHEKDALS